MLKAETKKGWMLDKWWKKVIYCIGWFSVIEFIILFTIGFILGYFGLI
jgi:hypothetical protein